MKKILYVLAVVSFFIAGIAAANAECIPATPPGEPTVAYQPCDENLIVNGDFEEIDGNLLGFTSDYRPYLTRATSDPSFTVRFALTTRPTCRGQ